MGDIIKNIAILFFIGAILLISGCISHPAISLQPLYAVTDNVTKDSFFVLVFDSSGNRVDSPVNWKARGVV
jgi:hypothetical protein